MTTKSHSRTARLLIALILCSMGSSLGLLGFTAPVATVPNASTALSNARGIYVYSEHPKNTTDMQQLEQSLQMPGVDGLSLLIGWADIENGLHSDGSGRFAWDDDSKALKLPNLLDDFIGMAIAAGKKVDLAIRADGDTPCWLFQQSSSCTIPDTSFAGATPLTFVAAAVQGGGGANCNLVSPVAAPWNPIFLQQWDQLLSGVANHLKGESFIDNTTGQPVLAWDAISSVRLTGINRTTTETRLPAEILAGGCGNATLDQYLNSVAIWLNAGYRPSKLLTAWKAVTASFQNYFPGKIFTMPIIPDASGDPQNPDYPFPQIDENGCIYTPPVDPANFSVAPGIPSNNCANPIFPDDNAPIIRHASELFSGSLVVAYQSLVNGQPAEPYVAVTAPQNWGTMTGFQTNDFVGPFQRAACSGGTKTGTVCATSDDYLALLEIGIFPTCPVYSPNRIPADEPCRMNPRSQYIEVLPPDVVGSTDPKDAGPGYAAAILQAHAELVDYTPPNVTIRSSKRILPPTGHNVKVKISGSITDDLSGVAPGTPQFSVKDSYGQLQFNGPVTVNSDGTYSFVIRLQATVDRLGPRVYTVTVNSRDYAGNAGLAATTISVLH